MATKEVDAGTKEIKQILKSDKVVLGTKETLQSLKEGSLSKVLVSSNCPESVKKDIKYYAKLGDVKVVAVKYPNDELGILCKRPYSVSVLGVLA